MAEPSQGSRKASKNIQHPRDCTECGRPVSVIHAHDVQTGLRRILLIEPDGDSAGWLVINDEGAFMDSDYTIKGGSRYRRHVCPARKAS